MKKILPFIIILSLIVPFLPSFDFTLYALPYTPSESENSWIEDFKIKFQTYLGNNGVVANSDWFNTDYVGGFWNDLLDFMGFAPIQDKDFASSVYDYSIQNNITADMLFTDSSQFILNKVNSEIPYQLRRTCQVSEFYNQILPLGNNSIVNGYIDNLFRMLKPIVNANSSFVYIFTDTSYDLSFGQSFIYGIDKSLFTDSQYAFYTIDSNFRSNYYNNDYGFYRAPDLNSTNVPYGLPGYLWLVSGNSILPYIDTKSVTLQGYQNTQSSVTDVRLTSSSHRIFEGVRNFLQFNKDINFYGSVLLVADSVSEFEIPIFVSNGEAQLFYSGRSTFYKFDSSVDLGSNSSDIDYSRLYDIISTEVSHSSGNVVNAINNVANNYLQEQIDLLHDINNALNDGNGQSWLRRIYGLLDYNFPLTLDAFEDLISAVQNISVSGGGDFSEATRVLHEIDLKLGILIDEPFTDLTDTDWNQMKSRIQTKFPFCIFSDIVAISVILNRPPQQPDLNFVIPIIGSESENLVHIDLSPYEHARPYVHGALIFVFIIGLLALSVKIFDHLKS